MFINLNRFKTSRLAKAISSLFLDFTATNTLDDRVSFSRTTNATVTNSAGLITYAPHNLLTFSEQFDNAAWTKTNSTVTANTTISPDGATTADKLIASGGAVDHLIDQNSPSISTGVIINESIYAKASECTEIRVRIGNAGAFSGAPQAVTFTLTGSGSGVIEQGTPTFAITSVGNGWYRCSITATAVATGAITIRFSPSISRSTSFDANGSGIFVWGAQLEIGSTATTYNPTTVKNLLGFTQEFDNAAWTKSNSFVQTNLLLRSEEFDSASWTATESTVTANSGIAPNGSQTADLYTTNATTGAEHYVLQTWTAAASTTYTASVYVKAGTGSAFSLQFRVAPVWQNSTNVIVDFNLTTGTGAASSGNPSPIFSITPVGNGWYRCTMTATTGAGGTPQLRIGTADGGGTLLLWGAQLVQGAVAGDYVRTSSTVMPVMYQAPNGTLSADKLVEDTANSTHYIRQTPTGTVNTSPVTLSVYAKAGERSHLFLSLQEGSPFTRQANVTFDLINGTSISPSGTGGATNVSASITPAGNGWYRCSLTATLGGSATSILSWIYVRTEALLSYTGNGTSGIYIWGAQLSDSASLDPYVYNPVAAPTAQAYYAPRFDYDPVTLQPKGLLIEEQRTNLLLQSETFNDATWAKANATVSANVLASPDGTLDADKLAEDNALSTHSITQAFNTTSGTSYTLSCYAKAGERNFIQLLMLTGFASNITALFDLTTGAVGTTAGSPVTQSVNVGNGWWRFSITATANATIASSAQIRPSSSSSTAFYQGVTGSGIFIYGAQLEAGAFATSYIPTVASQVTRAADTAVIQGGNFSSWYNQNEGTVYSQYSKGNITASGRVFTISNGTNNNQIRFSVVGRPDWQIVNNGSVEANVLGIDTSANAIVKIAGVYKNNDIQASVNGTLRTEDTTAIIPAVSIMHLGTNELLAGALNGHIQSFSYYNTRLSNATLQAITS